MSDAQKRGREDEERTGTGSVGECESPFQSNASRAVVETGLAGPW